MKKRATGKSQGSRGRSGATLGAKAGNAGVTFDQARARIAAGEDQTDWARVDAMTDADIDRSITEHRDVAPRLGDDFWQTAELLTDAATADKIVVTLRVDRDVVARFKKFGPGYQSRMNAVLRAYAERAP